MSPAIKYTFGRIGLFVVIVAALLPFKLNLFLSMMIALAVSMPLSYFLLRRWREPMAERIGESMAQRHEQKDRLRAALSDDAAGEDTQPSKADAGQSRPAGAKRGGAGPTA